MLGYKLIIMHGECGFCIGGFTGFCIGRMPASPPRAVLQSKYISRTSRNIVDIHLLKRNFLFKGAEIEQNLLAVILYCEMKT
jgi:hypothetical protein